MPSTNIDLIDLVRRLKQEKLFVSNERKEIESLNRKVQLLSTGLLHQTWLTGQYRLTLESLCRGQVSLSCPFVSSNDAGEAVDNLELVEAHRLLSPRHLPSYTELIVLLRAHPEIVALCMHTYEKEKSNLTRITGQALATSDDILHSIINVYGGIGAPLPEDSSLLLKLLSNLAGLQLVGNDSIRKVIRQGSSAFGTLYRLISETIPSSRLFLIGALHEPVRQLLCLPDLDQLGAISPTSPHAMDTSHSSGMYGVNKDLMSLDRTDKIARLTKQFIESILENIQSFPTGLAWLIKSIHSQLISKHDEKEVAVICTDLIWALFICPAVTNPEPFGVTDAPVDTQARQTLSQVATILQALALRRWEGNDPRLTEYTSFFQTDCLGTILDQVLATESLPSEHSGLISTLSRRTVLLPENLLKPLCQWFRECMILLEQNGKLTEIDIWPTLTKLSIAVTENTARESTLSVNSAASSGGASTGSTSSLSSSPLHNATTILANGKRVLLNRKDNKVPKSTNDVKKEGGTAVIIFPITHHQWEWVGMLPESEVISKNGKVGNGVLDMESLGGMDDGEDEERMSNLGEKRTRFSLSHDDGSIGTSDNLEAVSEAASTHSVSSSIELEDQNDNFSDMLSANVSGRGTPNVSGRNTPLSQAEQEDNENDHPMDEDMLDEAQNQQPPNHNLNPPNLNNLNINGLNPSKQATSEIDDKFCKFEIRKLFGGDETISLVSDTWSTDVLASDSEMGGDGQQTLQLPQGINASGGSGANLDLPQNASVTEANMNNETMSEAWSTDVAASDIERMHDFDTDDTASVARSDYTGLSELEGMPFDTPRSSVSGGGGPYRRPQDPDLLMFEDNQQEPMGAAAPIDNVPSSAGAVGGSSSTLILPGSMPAEPDMEVNSVNSEDVLISEIVTPGGPGPTIQLNLSSASNSLQAPGSGGRPLAIPKTITFDKTAERGDRENWDDETGRTRRFFRNFRLPFRGKSRKTSRGHDDRLSDWDRPSENPSIPVPKLRKSFSEDVNAPSTSQAAMMGETSDEILAKYRRKPSLTESSDSPVQTVRENMSMKLGSGSIPIVRKESLKMTRAELFVDARKKLRNVLSNCDLHHVQSGEGNIDTIIINLMRVEMSSAISRADQVAAAQLQEAIRTVKQLGLDGCRKLMRLLKDNYRRRSDFVSYLMRAKQGLLSAVQFLERATVRSKHEGETYSHYLINECVRLWLEEPTQSAFVEQFINNFKEITAVDEKMELLENFLCRLMDTFYQNKELSEGQFSIAGSALEQHVVCKIYHNAMFPNEGADCERDRKLQDHILELEAVVTPSHRDLRIPKSQLSEYPWPPAQRELKMLSAYRTPADKLRCVIRAASLIVSLLNASSDKVVAADDFIPVLVFVIIKCNPSGLLSTIQYVNSFYGLKITGEDQYWWTQFCSAIEFIKTMDYTE